MTKRGLGIGELQSQLFMYRHATVSLPRMYKVPALIGVSDSTLSGRFVFLDWIRAIAVLMVVYAHNVAGFSEAHGELFPIVSVIRTSVNEPLGIIQDFGWFGVVMFFLTSGFIISHVSQKEGSLEFTIKRLFRIFPLLMTVVALECLRRFLVGEIITFGSVFRNMFLINYVTIPQVIYIGVAWTLLIEMIFYIMTILSMKSRNAHFIVAVNLFLVLIVVSLSRRFGDSFFLFAASTAYVPIIIAGQIIYFGVIKKAIRPTLCCLYIGFCYLAFFYSVSSIHTPFAKIDNSYMVSVVFSVMLFFVFVLLRGNFVANKTIMRTSSVSYTIYLTHGTFGLLAANMLFDILGAAAALFIGLAVTVVSTFLLNMFIEVPLNRFGARISSL